MYRLVCGKANLTTARKSPSPIVRVRPALLVQLVLSKRRLGVSEDIGRVLYAAALSARSRSLERAERLRHDDRPVLRGLSIPRRAPGVRRCQAGLGGRRGCSPARSVGSAAPRRFLRLGCHHERAVRLRSGRPSLYPLSDLPNSRLQTKSHPVLPPADAVWLESALIPNRMPLEAPAIHRIAR